MLKDINFESERLITQKLYKKDTEMLLQIYSDSGAMKYRGSKAMKSIEDAIRMVEEQYIENKQVEKIRIGIRKKSDNRLIGTLLLTNDKNAKSSVEIGFSFAKNHWGNGFGQETLSMVECKLPRFEKLEKLRAWCINENIASIRIFQKAGFSEVTQNKYPQSTLLEKALNNIK